MRRRLLRPILKVVFSVVVVRRRRTIALAVHKHHPRDGVRRSGKRRPFGPRRRIRRRIL